jgi:type II secretion system (T2SS) protein E
MGGFVIPAPRIPGPASEMDCASALAQDREVARPRISIEELLLRHRAINEEQLERARAEQKRRGGDIGRALVDLGYVSEELLLRAQAHQLGIPLVDPVKDPPPMELVQCLPRSIAERFMVIPVGGSVESRVLRVATSAPGDALAMADLSRMTGYQIELAAATRQSIKEAIAAAYSRRQQEVAPEEPHPEIEPLPDPAVELHDLRLRLDAAERQLSNRQYAAALARIERLEQMAETDHHSLNVVVQVLLEIGAVTRDDLKRRFSKS